MGGCAWGLAGRRGWDANSSCLRRGEPAFPCAAGSAPPLTLVLEHEGLLPGALGGPRPRWDSLQSSAGLGEGLRITTAPPTGSLSFEQINNTKVGHALVLPARGDLTDFLKNVLTCHICLGKARACPGAFHPPGTREPQAPSAYRAAYTAHGACCSLCRGYTGVHVLKVEPPQTELLLGPEGLVCR